MTLNDLFQVYNSNPEDNVIYIFNGEGHEIRDVFLTSSDFENYRPDFHGEAVIDEFSVMPTVGGYLSIVARMVYPPENTGRGIPEILSDIDELVTEFLDYVDDNGIGGIRC